MRKGSWLMSCSSAPPEDCVLTLLDTPVELSQDVIKQDVTEGLKILGEDITDGIQCMVAGGGHPLCFLQVKHNLCEFFFFFFNLHKNKEYNAKAVINNTWSKTDTAEDETVAVPQSVAQEASCCQRSWRQFWTGLATSVSRRCGHRSSSLQTSLSAPWEMNTHVDLSFLLCDSWHLLLYNANIDMSHLLTLQSLHSTQN